MQSFELKFLGVTILQGVEFPIFLLIFEWALQQCSATALPVIASAPPLKPTIVELLHHRPYLARHHPTFERRFCIAWAVLSSSSSSSSLLHSQVDHLYFIIIIVSCHDVLERVHQLFHL